MEERFIRNIGAITAHEQELLNKKKAAIAGCGGLGCYAAEFLARLGVGHFTLIDGDVFAASNLNRQLYSLEANIGRKKASEAKKRLLKIITSLSVEAADTLIDEKNAEDLLKGHDIIIDALDNVKTRLIIEKAASSLGIPLIHGAVEEWGAQVCVVFPGELTLSMLYSGSYESKKPSVLSFTPAFCASLQASEAVKVLLKKKNILRKKFLTVSLKDNSFNIIDL